MTRFGKFALPLSLAGLLAVLPAVAPAQGLYIRGAAGINQPMDSDLDSAGTDREGEFERGFTGLAALGYEINRNLRSELELGYRTSDVDKIAGTDASGEFNTWSGMVNLLYDFDVAAPVRPFLGIGAGLARVEADSVTPLGSTRVDDSDTGFAYQLIAGVEYPIDDRLRLDLSYRFFSAPDIAFSADSGSSVDSEYADHSVMVGLRFRFGAPAPAVAAPPPPAPAPVAQRPPPPPAPAPAPPPVPRTYLVFFDFDSSALTPQARQIIATAAANARTAGLSRVVLVGHADRAGPSRYNVGLSQRRAEAVKAEFVRLGIAAGEIATTARGESSPLVPTADGVREPRNRRVEIELQ